MIHLWMLGAYIVMIIGIGIISRKKVNGISDFLLGGRSVNPWMSAFSYGTAYFSAVLFIGYAGKLGWNFGVPVLWIAIGNMIVGSFLAWQILGTKTREMTQRLNASTMPEFISIRYNSKALKKVTAIIIFVFLVPYSASIYKGLGFLFEEIFGIDMKMAMLVMTIVTAIYLFLGGFVAATLADFIQGIIMIFGVIFMLYFVFTHPSVGGVSNALSNLGKIDPNLTKMVGQPNWIILISLVVLTSLGSWGLPQMVHKFYTIKNEKSIICAKWVSTIFAGLIATGAYGVGSVSRLVLNNQMPEKADMIIPQVIAQTLPNFVSAIILVLVFSASMSTLASIVLASSSSITIDLLKGSLLPNLDSKKQMIIMKILCVFFVVLSFVLAIGESSILALASLSWGAVSGCLLAPYLLGLYWKGATKAGVWASITTALLIVIIGSIKMGINSPYLPVLSASAIVVPLIVLPVVSVVTKVFDKEHIEFIFNEKNVAKEA